MAGAFDPAALLAASHAHLAAADDLVHRMNRSHAGTEALRLTVLAAIKMHRVACDQERRLLEAGIALPPVREPNASAARSKGPRLAIPSVDPEELRAARRAVDVAGLVTIVGLLGRAADHIERTRAQLLERVEDLAAYVNEREPSSVAANLINSLLVDLRLAAAGASAEEATAPVSSADAPPVGSQGASADRRRWFDTKARYLLAELASTMGGCHDTATVQRWRRVAVDLLAVARTGGEDTLAEHVERIVKALDAADEISADGVEYLLDKMRLVRALNLTPPPTEEASGAPPAPRVSSVGAADLGKREEEAVSADSALAARLDAADALADVAFEFITAVEAASRAAGLEPGLLPGPATEYGALRAARGVYLGAAREHARQVARESGISHQEIERDDLKSPQVPHRQLPGEPMFVLFASWPWALEALRYLLGELRAHHDPAARARIVAVSKAIEGFEAWRQRGPLAPEPGIDEVPSPDDESPRWGCARDSDWCDGLICRAWGIDCPNADPVSRSETVEPEPDASPGDFARLRADMVSVLSRPHVEGAVVHRSTVASWASRIRLAARGADSAWLAREITRAVEREMDVPLPKAREWLDVVRRLELGADRPLDDVSRETMSARSPICAKCGGPMQREAQGGWSCGGPPGQRHEVVSVRDRESAVSPEYARQVYAEHAEAESSHRPLSPPPISDDERLSGGIIQKPLRVVPVRGPKCPECDREMALGTHAMTFGGDNREPIWWCRGLEGKRHSLAWCEASPPPLAREPGEFEDMEAGEIADALVNAEPLREPTEAEVEAQAAATADMDHVAPPGAFEHEVPPGVEGATEDPQKRPAWTCEDCGQRNVGWSDECGRCGATSPRVRAEYDEREVRVERAEEISDETAEALTPLLATMPAVHPKPGDIYRIGDSERRILVYHVTTDGVHYEALPHDGGSGGYGGPNAIARFRGDFPEPVARMTFSGLHQLLRRERRARERASGSPERRDEPPLEGTTPAPADVPRRDMGDMLVEAHQALQTLAKRVQGLKFNAELANRHTARAIERTEALEGALGEAIDYITRNVTPSSPGVEHRTATLLEVLNARPEIGLPEPVVWPDPLPEIQEAFEAWRKAILHGARLLSAQFASIDDEDLSPGEIVALTEQMAPTVTALVTMLSLEHGCNEPDDTPVDKAIATLRGKLNLP